MMGLDSLLAALHRREISQNDFARSIEALIHGGSATPTDIELGLLEELRSGRVSNDTYRRLLATVGDITKFSSRGESRSETASPPNPTLQPGGIEVTQAPQTDQVATVVASERLGRISALDSATRIIGNNQSTSAGRSLEVTSELTREPLATRNEDIGGAYGRDLAPGDILKERFVLEQVIGTGGMGVVFKALDLRKKEAQDREPYVALKILNQDFREKPTAFIALQREAKRAQTLSHPNIINVYDFDRDGPHVYMSMEYLDQQPLSRYIKALPEGGLPFKKAWPIIHGMGSALAYAHEKGIVHSDFKPGNVFIDDRDHVIVLDFGIACAVGRADKRPDEATIFNARSLGALTPAYASLEMLNDEDPDARDDIYALACVTYELLTGKHPFGKLTAQQALELSLKPKPIPGLSRRQWRALQHGLALKRADRTPSVDGFLGEIQGRSALFYGSWAAGALMLGITASAIYVYFTGPPLPLKATVEMTPELQTKINDLLDLAEVHFEVGYLTAPTGSNALWAFQQVLKIDPYNESAIRGIKKIADELEQQAWAFYEQGQRVESMRKVNEGLEADPQHPGLLALKRKLQN